MNYCATVPPGSTWDCVYIDDILVVEVYKPRDIADGQRLRGDEVIDSSHRAYEFHNLPRATKKSFRDESRFLAWGTEVDDSSGRVGVSREKLGAVACP